MCKQTNVIDNETLHSKFKSELYGMNKCPKGFAVACNFAANTETFFDLANSHFINVLSHTE